MEKAVYSELGNNWLQTDRAVIGYNHHKNIPKASIAAQFANYLVTSIGERVSLRVCCYRMNNYPPHFLKRADGSSFLSIRLLDKKVLVFLSISQQIAIDSD